MAAPASISPMPAANDTFNYLAVLFSIIIGLAATELLQSVRGLLVARRRVVVYAPSLIRAATLMLILAQSWWATFGLRTHADWTFGMYASVLLQIVLMYLVVALALPSATDGDGPIDLRAAYFAHSKLVYALLVAAALASILKDYVINDRLPEPANFAFHLLLIAVSAVQAMSRSDLLHKLTTGFSLVAFCGYVVVLFDKLPS